MRLIKYIVLLLVLLYTGSVQAQTSTYSGVVSDNSGPILGVIVSIAGSTSGTSTDFDGKFTIEAKANDKLLFEFVGYVKEEVILGDNKNLTITMKEDVTGLEEIVVVGYGTQTKKEVTGAVSVVGKELINKLQPVRVEQALQGQVAGVQISSTSGSPGAGSTISIRGVATNGDNRPLILVDGNVLEDLAVINPNDIESINVLKDATAGIYGVRAANGVILIKTKTGFKNTKLRFNVDAYTGIQQTSRKLAVLNSQEYATIINESFLNGGQQPPFTNVVNPGENTDWQDEVFQTAPISSINFGFDGGTKKLTYSAGVNFLSQDGIVGGSKSNFTRFVGRANVNYDPIKNVKLTSSFIYTFTDRKTLSESALGSVLFNALNMDPTLSIRDAQNNYTLAEGLGNEVINPLAQIDDTNNLNLTNKFSGTFGVQYDFLDHFSASSKIQFNVSRANGNSFAKIANYGSGKVFNVSRNRYNEYNDTFTDYTWDNFITYKNEFGDHNVTVLLGSSAFRTVGNYSGQTGFDIPDNDYANASIANASDVVTNYPNGGDTFDARLLSYFARVQYGFKSKYLISGVLRRDGSTKFGPNNRFGLFPSFSLGWVISEESFLKDNDVLNFLKFRLSYGILGNDRIEDYLYTSLLNGEGVYVFQEELQFGKAVGKLSNPEIRWERQKTFDVGFDAAFLDNKIDITADYFLKRTEDLLVSAQVSGILGPAAPGSTPPTINAGIVENSGFEFKIAYNDKINNDFNYSLSYNITTLNNNVVFVDSENGFITGGAFGVGQDPPSRMEQGKPIGYFYGYKTNGIFQTAEEVAAHATQANAAPGELKFVDMNNDGVIDTNDRTDLGNPIPDFTMGFNLSFNYKNFDFSSYTYASIGNEIVRNYERIQNRTNKSIYTLNRWTPTNTDTTTPRITTGSTSIATFSDYYVEDGSYLRLQNIQIGYNIDSDVLERLKLTKFRIYASINNLFTLTKYRGFDPSASSGDPIGGGIDQGFYPVARTFILGINLKF